MSMNIKTELFEESSNIVDLSSDEDDLVPEKNDIPEIKQPERPRTPDTHCSICLDELTNKCYPNTCFHMFCFECLKHWSTIQSSCPLCKTNFKSIHHTLTEGGLYEIYDVPLRERALSPRIFIRPFSEMSDVNRVFRMNLFLDIVRRNERLMSNITTDVVQDHNHNHNHNHNHFNINSNGQFINISPRGLDLISSLSRRRQSFGQALRVRIYTENRWAEPLPDLSGRFRECNSAFYRENPAQTHRLHGFILRDISAIRSLQIMNPLEGNQTVVTEEFVTNLIMRSVSSYEIRDTVMTTLLQPYLGDHTVHFCHELFNYANSPYDLIGYDRNVRYSLRMAYPTFFRPLPEYNGTNLVINNEPLDSHPIITSTFSHGETIVLDSDEDEIVETDTRRYPTEIIVVTSSDDDSDVEILGHSFRPIETFDSTFRDQPSTSTGIRDSLDRPNNRYNFRSRRHSSVNSSDCPVHLSQLEVQPNLSRGRIILDYSSSDEESLTSTRSTQTVSTKGRMVCSKRKRKIKKNKRRKRNTCRDSRSENCIGNRSRSHSESSSSGDADIGSNNLVSIGTNAVM